MEQQALALSTDVCEQPVRRRRGRPRVHADAAAKQAAYRARKGARTVSVVIDDELAAGLDAYMARQHADGPGRDLSAVIAHLLRSQLLRKR